MIFHREYTDVPAEEVDRFVRAQEMGRLVTVGADGTPHVGLYPFVYDGNAVEIHIVRADEQVADLRARPRAVFEVDDVLGVIPSYWLHAENAAVATAYHRTVILEGDGVVSEDGDVIVAQQRRLMAKHQPEGRFRPLDPRDPMYAGMIAKLAAVTVRITARRVKWKLGQNRPPEARRTVIAALRKRGRPNDERAAAALEWTLAPRTAAHGDPRA